MKKRSYILPIILLFACLNRSYAQDTLFYTNGTIKPVKILQIDSVNKKLKYQQADRVAFVLWSALDRVAINSNPDVAELEVKATKNTVKSYSRPVRYGFLEKPFEEDFGRFSVGFNVLSLLTWAFSDCACCTTQI